MGFHPYDFKWRLRSFNGLLVMILRRMGDARELDSKVAQSASKIEELEKKLDAFKSKGKKVETKREAKSLTKKGVFTGELSMLRKNQKQVFTRVLIMATIVALAVMALWVVHVGADGKGAGSVAPRIAPPNSKASAENMTEGQRVQ